MGGAVTASMPSTSAGIGSGPTALGTTQQQIFSDIAYYRGQLVALKHIKKEHMQLSRGVLLEFNEVGHVIPGCVDVAVCHVTVGCRQRDVRQSSL